METTPEEVVTEIPTTEQSTYEVLDLGSTTEEAKKEIICTKEKKGVVLVLMTFPIASSDMNWFHLVSRLAFLDFYFVELEMRRWRHCAI